MDKTNNYFGLSKAGRQWNEDTYGISEKYGFVLDGATVLSGEHYTSSESDAKWYSNKWADYLKENINNDESIFDILTKGNDKIMGEYKAIVNKKDIIDYPSCTCALYREVGDEIEFFVIGDSAILIESSSNHYFSIEDTRNKANDGIVINMLTQIARDEHKPLIETIKNHPEVVRKTRKNKNSLGHYFVLSDNTQAILNGISYRMPKKYINKIIAITDGYAQVYDTMCIMTLGKMISKINTYDDALKIYNKLYKAQDKDNTCDKHPRHKLRDDATIVCSIINK